MKAETKKFLSIFGISLGIGLVLFALFFAGAIFGLWGNMDDLDIEGLTLRQNSALVYLDAKTGEEKVFQYISTDEDRVWADIEKIPTYLQHAFVSIEDERFYEHNGFDFRRTTKATLTWFGNKLLGKSGVSLGGSTITQQLIKNITGDKDQTPARKIQEISRAIALEKELEKDEILELYLNCIYLSQGCNGVQTAAGLYFDKDVKDLSLAESASIAGITQYPSLYDPFVNPDKNKARQELVLSKMLELGYISQGEHDKAVKEKLEFADPEKVTEQTGTNSYFVDQVIRDVLRDLEAKGYSKSLANKILYTGGVKIYTTYNPEVQTAMEDYYTKTGNFPNSNIQSAMVVTDVQTGAVVGMVGGIGEKPGSLTLNRATSPRQPGSTIKPLAVYAPALEKGIINPASAYDDVAKSYGEWTPRNYDYSYRGRVNVRSALRSSLNTVPVEILSQMGAQAGYDFLVDKLGITTLVKGREIDGKTYTDIGYSPLALGGLTDGVTALEMTAAFATFANNGIYRKPYLYTEVKDKEGNVLVTSDQSSWKAMDPSTAFVMHQMLLEVVSGGTGGGAGVSGYPTAGKTGTTSDNNDRWFIGYTPHYAAAVWYGYDIPDQIYASGNPCIPVFRNIMNTIHKNTKPEHRTIQRPSNVISVSYCAYTGKRAVEGCPTESFYFIKGNTPGYCNSDHEGYEPEGEEEENAEEGEGGEGTEGSESTNPTGTSTPATSSPTKSPSVVTSAPTVEE